MSSISSVEQGQCCLVCHEYALAAIIQFNRPTETQTGRPNRPDPRRLWRPASLHVDSLAFFLSFSLLVSFISRPRPTLKQLYHVAPPRQAKRAKVYLPTILMLIDEKEEPAGRWLSATSWPARYSARQDDEAYADDDQEEAAGVRLAVVAATAAANDD